MQILVILKTLLGDYSQINRNALSHFLMYFLSVSF